MKSNYLKRAAAGVAGLALVVGLTVAAATQAEAKGPENELQPPAKSSLKLAKANGLKANGLSVLI